jgi:hypothetical protein
MPNADYPGLGIWKTLKKSIGSRQYIIRYFKGSGFDVDRDDLAMITFFDVRSNL